VAPDIDEAAAPRVTRGVGDRDGRHLQRRAGGPAFDLGRQQLPQRLHGPERAGRGAGANSDPVRRDDEPVALGAERCVLVGVGRFEDDRVAMCAVHDRHRHPRLLSKEIPQELGGLEESCVARGHRDSHRAG